MKNNKETKELEISRQEPTLGDIVYEKLDDHFKKSLPIDSLRQLPRPLLYALGSIAQIVFLGLFGYFIYSTYTKAINQQYVSLNIQSGNCLEVGKPLTGQFYATYNGYWEGDTEFEYNQASYSFTFSNLNLSTNPNQEFYDLMIKFQTKYLVDIEELSYKQTLPSNLLYWMNYIQVIPMTANNNQKQTFQFIGQPSAVFDTQYQIARVSNYNGTCAFNYSSSYYSFTGTQTLTIPIISYKESYCDTVVSPYYLGYKPFYDLDNLVYSFDYNSFTTAVAVNAGILPIEYLLTLNDGYLDTITYNDVLYSYTRNADPRYPGMEPIVCIQNLTDTSADSISNYPITKFCFLDLFSVTDSGQESLPLSASLGIPILTHYEYCYCDNDQVYSKFYGYTYLNDYCNQFDLITNIVMFSQYSETTISNTTYDFIAYSILDLISSYNYTELTDLVYYSSPVSYSYTGDFSYCNDLCSVLAVNSYYNYGTPSIGYGGSVNDYYYQILHGACNNTFNSPNWNDLASSPPTLLTESYFRCTPFVLTALESAVGIANGNTSTVMPFLIFVLIPSIYILLSKYGLLRQESYTKQQKDATLNDLAILLLKLRDLEKKNPNAITDPVLKNLLNAVNSSSGLNSTTIIENSNDHNSENVSAVNPIYVKSNDVGLEMTSIEIKS